MSERLKPVSGRFRSLGSWLISLFVAVSLAGCGSIPVTGPVDHIEDVGVEEQRPRVDIEPLPPSPSAAPELIIEGFLSAIESPSNQNRYDVARAYLTPEASANWRPEVGTTIYSPQGQSWSLTEDGTAILRATVVGHVDEAGVYTPEYDESFSHNFQLVHAGGQWRISNPGDGVLMSTARFERSYQPTTIYFPNRALTAMVPQIVHLPSPEAKADTVLRALRQGPSDWLSPVVSTMIPPSAPISAYVDDAKILRVTMNEEVESLSEQQRVALAAQLLWTVDGLTPVEGVKVNVSGRMLAIRGMDGQGIIRAQSLGKLTPPAKITTSSLLVLREGAVAKVMDVPSSTRSILTGTFPGQHPVPMDRLSIGWGGRRLGLLNADHNELWTMDAGAVATVAAKGENLGAPQAEADGTLYWTSRIGPVPILNCTREDGSYAWAPMPELSGMTIVEYEVSPDRTRLAVVVDDHGARRVGLLRISSGERFSVDGWSELRITAPQGPMGTPRDLAWRNGRELLVLGQLGGDTKATVIRTQIDGSGATNLGPIGEGDPVRVATLPGATTNATAVLLADGSVLRFEAALRWTPIATQVTDLAYSR